MLLLVVAASCSDEKERGSGTSPLTRDVGAPPRFALFESGQVRPLALSADGKRLYAVNTPAARLEIFDVKHAGLEHVESVPVGLEPVAVAARGQEVWVVNHLSDSVSVIDVHPTRQARVVRTLLVGDEPRDIVFAGPGGRRAFITTAHRGQNIGFDPQLQTPGVGRADVWVFDAANLGGSLGGSPLTVVTLFTDTPRALAVSPDGARVYAAGFQTGNRTTALHEANVPDGGEANGGLPNPRTDAAGNAQPETGLIVKFDGVNWKDSIGRIWPGIAPGRPSNESVIKFNLPDKDVFTIDAMATPPVELEAEFFRSVGTILFNMIVNPVSGKVYVANTEAFNHVRFSGPGTFAGTSTRGHLHESRITVLHAGVVEPRHLNKHIDYGACCAARPNDENARSLAFPQSMAISRDGRTLYVPAFGSSKIGVFDTTQLENDSFVPSTANQIAVSGGGPSGVVLDEDHGRLYVMTRFDNSVVVVDTSTRTQTARLPLPNPEPASVVLGRPFLYDAARTSSHGDSACASCHVYGDGDSLAWDLGNPDETDVPNPNPFTPLNAGFGLPADTDFKALKGPMATQSLRGMANHGPMHWRGDRTGGGYGIPNAQPDSGAFDEDAAFKQFNPAFQDLLGNDLPLSDAEMQAFTDFALQIMYPPNPVRALDNELTPDQQAGRDHFFTPMTDIALSCNDCHRLDPAGNSEFGVDFPGFFGTDGRSSIDTLDPVIPQTIKVPHLRDQYQKVGMFGLAPTGVIGGSDTEFGDQVRGFGYLRDGSMATIFDFVSGPGFSDLFSPHGFPFGPAGDELRRQVADFLLAFDSNLKPIVGQQITLTASNGPVAGARIDLLIARAEAGDCELVVKARPFQEERGFLYDGGSGAFVPSRTAEPDLSDAALRQLATQSRGELTYTCVPPGSGLRLGIDADLDGFLDGDEEDAGSDPYDPASAP